MKTAERRWVLKLTLGGFCFDFLSTLSFRSSERKGAGVGVWGCSQYSFSKSGFTFSNRGIKQNYDAKTILPSELSDNLSVLNNTGKTPLLSPLESLFPFWIPYTYIPGTKCSIYRGKGRRTSRNGSVFDLSCNLTENYRGDQMVRNISFHNFLWVWHDWSKWFHLECDNECRICKTLF